jgi:hypothetical protein
MATFDAYPAQKVATPAAPNLMGMANNAAQLNQTLVQTTGMNLDQHFKRLGALANGMSALINPQNGTADPAAVKNGIIDAVKQGILTKEEGAKQYTSVPSDPTQAGTWLRSHIAAVGAGINAIQPHLQPYNMGGYQAVGNSNPIAAGGASVPGGAYSMTPGQAASPVSTTNAQGQPVYQTLGGFAATHGAMGNPLAPIQRPSPQQGPQAQAAPAAPGGATVGASPADQAYFQKSAEAFASDQRMVQDYPNKMANLDELASELGNVNGGPGAEMQAKVGALLGQVGINLGEKQATAANIMDKVTAMLAQGGTLTGAPGSDKQLFTAMHATPNKSMTPAAAAASVALLKGQLLYKQNAVQEFNATGKPPQEYNKWFSSFYQSSAPSPLVLAVASGNMPQAVKDTLKSYVMKLPKNQQIALGKQFLAYQKDQNGK